MNRPTRRLSPDLRQSLRSMIDENPRLSSGVIALAFEDRHGIPIHISTVCRAMKDPLYGVSGRNPAPLTSRQSAILRDLILAAERPFPSDEIAAQFLAATGRTLSQFPILRIMKRLGIPAISLAERRKAIDHARWAEHRKSRIRQARDAR